MSKRTLQTLGMTALACISLLQGCGNATSAPAVSDDGCRANSTPVVCYEAELRSLGKARGELEREAANAKAAISSKDSEISQLRAQLDASSRPNPAYKFLIGTWCDEAVPGSPHIQQSVLNISGRDVLFTEGQLGLSAAHLMAAPPNEWEVDAFFKAGPTVPPVKITTHG